jgi:hypothetical protein
MEKRTGNEIMRNMEYLVKLLHREWERSGRTKAVVPISKTDFEAVRSSLARKIQKKQGRIGGKRLSFQHCMELSRENYILLRLAKKIKRAKDKTECQEKDTPFTVEMDEEEYKLFSMLTEEEKGQCC